MKKWLILGLLSVFLCAESLKIENLRTELYSKSAANTLKKLQISLEFEGENLRSNQSKILDATNTVISSFFYEDIFTELGKTRFKEAVKKFAAKHYELGISSIYILSLKGIETFDLDELKDFLQDIETPANTRKRQLKKAFEQNSTSLNAPKVPKIAPLPNINALLGDSNSAMNALLGTQDDLKIDDIDLKSLNLPDLELVRDIAPQAIRLKDGNFTGFWGADFVIASDLLKSRDKFTPFFK